MYGFRAEYGGRDVVREYSLREVGGWAAETSPSGVCGYDGDGSNSDPLPSSAVTGTGPVPADPSSATALLAGALMLLITLHAVQLWLNMPMQRHSLLAAVAPRETNYGVLQAPTACLFAVIPLLVRLRVYYTAHNGYD
jgi:hypothetical protein